MSRDGWNSLTMRDEKIQYGTQQRASLQFDFRHAKRRLAPLGVIPSPALFVTELEGLLFGRFSRKAEISVAISWAWVSRAKWPVS